uniref:NADH-ubiquinone oxidoreductase chain 6 n=1 Tax=Carapus bermudensis TaxID=181393 RepID=Q8HMI4_9TELE|nr:NADH dehydrogenase subunit 6 [Carapus bermudensis]BAC23175.1 NADH dehydrogenase subunit 6 [Carapus bermudensis]
MLLAMKVGICWMIVGLVGVASNPSPYFGALGLVMAASGGCVTLACYGGPFLSLVLFLIYLGGMLVVFAYSAALAAEPYPEAWGARPVAMSAVVYVVVLAVSLALSMKDGGGSLWAPYGAVACPWTVVAEMEGVAMLYQEGATMLVVTAGVLLLALFVVLELARGRTWGVLRAI